MHKQIDALALKMVNKVLKQHNAKVVKSSAGSARYLIQRKRVASNSYGAQAGSYYSVGVTYGEALLDVLKDTSKQVVKDRENGWYMRSQYGDNGLPVVLDEREMLQVELALA